jgi:hypothetical protein
MGIVPAAGTPGPTTVDVARRIANTDTSQCPVSEAPMACVDLTHQTFYITQNGSLLLGPTVTRTGMPGWATPVGHVPDRQQGDAGMVDAVQRVAALLAAVLLRRRAARDHDVHPQHAARLARLREPAARRRGQGVRAADVGSKVHLYGRRPGT